MNKINNTYSQIWEEIKKNDQITICSHINADGDTICSSLALKELIEINLNKKVKISGEKYPRYLDFLGKPDVVDQNFWDNSLKIVVDTSTKKRIFDQRIKTEESIKLDHHHHEGKWLLQVGGDHWPACGEVIWELIKDQNLKYNQNIKDNIFISIWTDTGEMRQRNISQQTKDIIQWSSQNKETILKSLELNQEEKSILKNVSIEKEGIVSYTITDKIITNDIYRHYVDYIYKKTKTEVLISCVKSKDIFRVGLRSKGNVDVSKYAAKQKGGGHFSSSGFNIVNKSFAEAKKIIKEVIKEINNDNKSRIK